MDREKLIEAARKQRTTYLPAGFDDHCIVDAILAEIKAQGYVIVPAKPTEAMEETARDMISPFHLAILWRAMLSALEDQ